MKLAFLVAALAHLVMCGNVGIRTSHHLSPADVTYVHGSYHAGLAAGPVGYSASIAAGPVATVTGAPVAAVAAGPALAAAPVAAVAAGPALAAAPVAAVAAGPALAAAPVAYAAPAPRYAAIPTVQHVPGVADVPVTRIDAQPGVIQKTIDVARPAVKTQRYEVRRPAIQKQFYDIEERVVVRPAGSAVLELEEPLSRTQKGPSVIQPSGGPVAVSTQAVAVPSGPAVSTAIPAGPASVSVAGAAALPSVELNLARSSLSGPAIASTVVSAPAAAVATPVIAAPAAAVAAPVYTGPASSISALPVKTVSAPVQASIVTGISSAGSSGITSISSGPSSVSVSTPVSIAQPIIHSTPAPLYSDEDSVSIDSAELALARSTLSRAHGSQIGLSKAVFQPIGQAYPAPSAVVASIPTTGSVFQSNLPTTGLAGHGSAIYSARNLQSEINHENQQKLIQLLTARGGVTEIGFGRSGPAAYPLHAGDIRGRVLSATPAPAYAAPAGERVNTRRVVVSRPIETLQEVEVAEPVTKFERVHVAQPTVIKSASPDVVRVPTSVPVYGKALAPIAEDHLSTLSTEWH